MGDELDALLTGGVSGDAGLAGLLRAARAGITEPPPEAVRAEHLRAVHGAAGQLTAPTRWDRLRERLTGLLPPARPAVGLATAAVVVLAALAVGGSLPAPVQRTVADVAGAVGVELPRPAGSAPVPGPSPSPTPGTDDTPAGIPPGASPDDESPASDGGGGDTGAGAPPAQGERPASDTPGQDGDGAPGRGQHAPDQPREEGGADGGLPGSDSGDEPARGEGPAGGDEQSDGRRDGDRPDGTGRSDARQPGDDAGQSGGQPGGDGVAGGADRPGGNTPGVPAASPTASQSPGDDPGGLIPDSDIPVHAYGSDQRTRDTGSTDGSDEPRTRTPSPDVDSHETAGAADRP